MSRKVAHCPQGHKITGVVETLLATAWVHDVYKNEDGAVEPDHARRI